MNNVTEFPIEFSADGKRNAFSHNCDIVGHSKNFAVCQHLIKERSSGRLEVLYADCSVAIGKKRCPAIAMMAKEKEAGKAIYFIERIKNMGSALMDAAIGMVVSRPVTNETSKAELPKSIDKSLVIDTGSYADALNSSLGEVAKGEAKPKAKVVEKTQPQVVTGKNETLMEMAKRMLAEQANKK